MIALINSANGLPLVFKERHVDNELEVCVYDSNKYRKEGSTFPLNYKNKAKQIIKTYGSVWVSEEEFYKYPLEFNNNDSNSSENEEPLVEWLTLYLRSGEELSHEMEKIKQPTRDYILTTIIPFEVENFVIEDDEGVSSYQTKYIEAITILYE